MRLLTALLWLGWADFWLHESHAPYAPLLAVVQAAAAVALMGLAVAVHSEHGKRRLDACLFFGTLVIVALVSAAAFGGTGFGTDELAYDQSAAATVLHGGNPYSADYTASLGGLGVGGGGTMTLNGTLVASLSYPALSFLLYVPAVALLGLHSYAGLVIDLVAWLVAGSLMWRMMSERTRPWVPLFLALPVLLTAINAGVTDPLYVPFELLALCCWDRFGDPSERSPARWIGPVALGLACCIKQTPWLLAPFLVMGVGFETRRRGQPWQPVTARYVAVAVLTFLLPNLPFLVANPSAWLSGVLLPVGGNLVPMGIGPVGWVQAYGLGGGNLGMFTYAALAALFAVLWLFFRNYASLKRVLPLLPLVALFVSPRSLSTYFGFVLPALAVNAATVRPAGVQASRMAASRLLSLVAPAACAVAILFVAAGLAIPAPLRISATDVRVTQTSFLATVVVTNLSTRETQPHFILAKSSWYQQILEISRGPTRLMPGETAGYQLVATLTALTPRPGDEYQIQAGSLSPSAISGTPELTVPGP